MKRLLFVLGLLVSIPLSASHIVGGEFELLHLSDYNYRLNLIYYYDVLNSQIIDPRAIEPTIDVHIYRKSDNQLMMVVQLAWLSRTRVGYTQPDCSKGEIVNDKIIYTNTLTLSPQLFNDPGGYYVVWSRCCRNYTITNIYSQDPVRVGAIAAGQTFYLEFPPVIKNGQQFINSSPKDFPALNDYACPTKPYYVDFGGVDDDGDSLAYTLITPLSTTSATAFPDPSPAPYPPVQWIASRSIEYSTDHAVNGKDQGPRADELQIDINGFLRVTPRAQGLYVFAVRVEEYRDKVKIGETRRDFQMLVTDCRLSVPPKIQGRELKGSTLHDKNIAVKFDNQTPDSTRCMVVHITDADAEREADNFQEVITVKVIPLNFKNKDLASLLPKETTGIIKNDGAIEFKICFPKCPYLSEGPYEIGVIAYDDACSLPLTDTLRVAVEVEPPHNERAKFVSPSEVTATLDEGETMSWEFEAQDAEKDELLFFALTNGFSTSTSGMEVKVTENVKGSGLLKGSLSWDAFCDIYDFTKRTSFTLKLLVDDVDACNVNPPDTATYHLNVRLPANADPIIDTDLTPDPQEVELGPYEKRIYDALTFTVTGTDLIDNRSVTLKIVGDGFNPAQYGMTFPSATAIGSVSSLFTWNLTCDKINPDERSEFNIGFVVIDSTSKCRVRQTDSLVVKVKVLKPLNTPPELSIVNLNNDDSFHDGNAIVSPNQALRLQLNVIDPDVSPQDMLTLDLIGYGDDTAVGWSFNSASGPSVLSSLFEWTPPCTLFEADDYENDYYFDFRYSDNRCRTAVVDTVRINVKVKDVISGPFEREPANVFTPNGDGYNDYYSMERRDDSGNLINILPPDNCRGSFQSIRIYNRWGRLVFSSSDRNFRWLGLNESAGVYFYHIVYTNRDFKGTVSLRD